MSYKCGVCGQEDIEKVPYCKCEREYERKKKREKEFEKIVINESRKKVDY